MGATGESVRRLTDFGYSPAWSPDGKQIVFATEGVIDIMARATTSQLWIIDVETGAKKMLYKGDAVHPQWSPHGSRIAFWGLSGKADSVISHPFRQRVEIQSRLQQALLWIGIRSGLPMVSLFTFQAVRGGSINLWRVPVDETSGKATRRTNTSHKSLYLERISQHFSRWKTS